MINSLSDQDLVKKIQEENDNEAAKELISRHENAVFSIIHKYQKKCPQLDLNDLIDEKYIIFSKAINSYKFDKNTKFCTWLSNFSKWHIIKKIKKATEDKCLISHETKEIDYLNNKNNNFSFSENTELKDYVFNILDQMKDERLKTIFELRYFGDKHDRKWKNISQKIGISNQFTLHLHNQACELLKKKLKSKNILNDKI